MTLNLEGIARIKGQRVGRQQIGIAHDRSSACAIVSKAGRIGSTRGVKREADAISAVNTKEES